MLNSVMLIAIDNVTADIFNKTNSYARGQVVKWSEAFTVSGQVSVEPSASFQVSNVWKMYKIVDTASMSLQAVDITSLSPANTSSSRA